MSQSQQPEVQYLSLCEAITYLAFREPMDREALAVHGFPSERTMGLDIRSALDQCKQQCVGNAKYEEFAGLVQDYGAPDRSPLRARPRDIIYFGGDMSWPPAAYYWLWALSEFQRVRDAEDKRLAAEAQRLLESTRNGKIAIRGIRYGTANRVAIEADDLSSRAIVKWTLNTIQVPKDRWVTGDKVVEWNDVSVRRADLVPLHSTVAVISPLPKEHHQKLGRPDGYDWIGIRDEIFRIMEYEGAFKLAEGWNQKSLEDMLKIWCAKNWGRVPGRTSLSDKTKRYLDEWLATFRR